MADFINTIDVLGDEAVMDSIINRTITEFKDNTLTKVGECAFRECKELNKVSLPLVETLSRDAFRGCSALEDVYFPKVKVIGQECFHSCTSLIEVADAQFPELVEIGYGAFGSCNGLLEVNHSKVQKIASHNAFSSSGKIERAILPSCTSIGNGAFAYCGKLNYVDLAAPSEIILEQNCFAGCWGLKSFIIRSVSMANLKHLQAFYHNGTPIGGLYFYVPKSLLSDDDATKDYRRATNWSTYATQFRALEDYTVDGTTTGALDETKI